ncbi:CRISPR-associated protein Csx19 [Calorimonas adulescens]|uniref:TIGR03984 family CRISPR-associated protein n=1 Tax=Calorimonas adulescens TaxID=2606906 RepID=A0A5D8QE89_9THEO|nr:CRISPR-associated protein Csx19 [Calorimonas adulescens]TZE82166.1 TIGR03984 family CRISPR-associated protein [Calorimonas adulescens]
MNDLKDAKSFDSYIDEINDTESLIKSINDIGLRYNANYMLAFFFDGVVWGKMIDGRFSFSSGIVENSPEINYEKLIECRIFGRECEVFLRKNDNKLYGSVSKDGEDYEEHEYMLWGQRKGKNGGVINGFTVVVENRGIRHAVPVTIDYPDNDFVVKLVVRNSIDYDEDGQAYYSGGRLCDIVVRRIEDELKRTYF